MGEDAGFSCGMKVIATGDAFNGLDEESLKYTVTGYGISSGIAQNENTEAWADYENAEGNS